MKRRMFIDDQAQFDLGIACIAEPTWEKAVRAIDRAYFYFYGGRA